MIRALLGPTNTGKTHSAIERMLELGSGMIGLPLRLLAREVYERVLVRVGSEKVALITGEERIVPKGALFWVCTVESMPVHLNLPFVAVDEIQLAAHPKRGHVFTDRILNLRGTRETWFLGSDTMIPIIERLTPTAEIMTRTRRSKLNYVPSKRSSSAPKRSALIAFSASHVYSLAEQLKSRRGGAAVVLGALSPKARNAQVAMFESGEVDFLVATDAIGMGLNLDIRSVFFGALRKYDGSHFRNLNAAEIGQIAGRAGRNLNDGFFGLTAECAARQLLPPPIVSAVERQEFFEVRRVFFRNAELDFTSVDSLRMSLNKRPRSSCLILQPDCEDEQVFEELLLFEDIATSVMRSSSNVCLLWDIARIPDYRQDSVHGHVKLLAQVYRQLIGPKGQLSPAWIQGRLKKLMRFDGDISTMMQRISYARTWAYIAHRPSWTENPSEWQAKALALEEKLSDALHERLTMEFVETPGQVGWTYPEPQGVHIDGETLRTSSIPLGRIVDFSFFAEPEAERIYGQKNVARKAREIAQPQARNLADKAIDGEEKFHWRNDLRVCVAGMAVAFVERGVSVGEPKVRTMTMDLLSDKQRRSLLTMAERWVRKDVQDLLEPMKSNVSGAFVRGFMHHLRTCLGVCRRSELSTMTRQMKESDRKDLARLQVRIGRDFVYSLPMLKVSRQQSRAVLLAAWLSLPSYGQLPDLRICADTGWTKPMAIGMGHPKFGSYSIRVDIFERVSAFMRKTVKRGPCEIPERPMQWLGCTRDAWENILIGMGYRIRKEGLFPPPRKRSRFSNK